MYIVLTAEWNLKPPQQFTMFEKTKKNADSSNACGIPVLNSDVPPDASILLHTAALCRTMALRQRRERGICFKVPMFLCGDTPATIGGNLIGLAFPGCLCGTYTTHDYVPEILAASRCTRLVGEISIVGFRV